MAEKKNKKTKMFYPWGFNQDKSQAMIFGRPAEKNEAGHFEVMVDAECVKNEKKRKGNRLIDKAEYEAWLKANAPVEEEE